MKKISPVDILNRLEENGFIAYFVGGCVRDELLHIAVNDFDIATNATPSEIERIFAEQSLDMIGRNFGVMLIDGIEVASFRSESYHIMGKPDVVLVGDFHEDSSRRDFTVNAMARTSQGTVIDYHGGLEDLESKIIRAVGAPNERFKEDPSRILRGMYLAARLDFKIESGTFAAMKKNRDLLRNVPPELIGKILEKVIKHNATSKFMVFLRDSNVLDYVFPELSHTVGLLQNPKYHDSDVFEHTIRVVRAVERYYPGNLVLTLSAIYHDCRKGIEGVRGINNEGFPNDLGHEEAGVPITEQALRNLSFGKRIIKQVSFLVRFHGLKLVENPSQTKVKRIIRKVKDDFPDKNALRRGLSQLIEFKKCDAEGFNPWFRQESLQTITSVQSTLDNVLCNTIFYRSELPVNGTDLMSWGVQGKQIGEMLDYLVIENVQDRKRVEKLLLRKGFNTGT
ncbi:CCA tRNA nucleotidyltransferase (plasmid) [Paenibacillus thiaminolyticus]|uniref:CCA tRNA nucleotidyltransferase n=1 Tax=Paenibacillus thiaminolyticus TaxID=49283 RepID=UPI002330D7E7|nr:CCA tRNA nucleotidyltransferase [Paenibacillus thiaminolyticus]WCF11537.1 CCA tRNA nucleotidyltransferase [Paenibacillus thiaminolyticus]